MEKIKMITEKEFETYKKSTNKKLTFKKLLGITSKKYEIGDTVAVIANVEPLSIYKHVWKGLTTYYLAVSIIDDDLAFTHSLYETT